MPTRCTRALLALTLSTSLGWAACSDALPETNADTPDPPAQIGSVTTVPLESVDLLADTAIGDDVTQASDADAVTTTPDADATETDATVTNADLTDATETDATVADIADAEDAEVEIDMGPPVYTSCRAAYDAGDTTSGLRLIEAGGTVYDAYCEQERGAVVGWTLVAKLTVAGETSGQGPWRPDADPNLWESLDAAEFGDRDIAVNADYRSPLFHLLPARQIRITRNDAFVLRTGDCLGDRTLAQVFRDTSWGCDQSQHSSYAECALTCPLGDGSVGDTNDQVFGDGVATITNLYLKAGETDDADPGYTDRTYVATDFIDNGFPHYVGGLGGHCFGAGCSGSFDVAARGDNPQRPDENSVWAIYVR